MANYKNRYTQKTYEILFPLLGDIMAQNVLKIQTRKIGKNEEILVAMDMPELAESIKVGLVIFVGSDVAKTIATNISLIK